jgi:beta-glucanase (GH16 family)
MLVNPFKPDSLQPEIPEGYQLLWNDEFNVNGKPSEKYWSYENGFVRNEELQWYQPNNANIENGVLVIEGKRENVTNNNFKKTSSNWRENREKAQYTSACVKTKGKFDFKYGIMEVRARIDTSLGMWPAIWTLGIKNNWPANGEVDQMEYYRHNGVAKILANAAWANAKMQPVWDSEKIPLSDLINKQPDWPKRFHIWKMDWTEEYIRLYLDDELLNEIDLTKTINANGFNPMHQEQYILLNLAIGANGGDPTSTTFPRKYEVDYVRVYQKKK